MLLHVQHLVGRDAAQHALKPRVVRAMEEELFPEAFGKLPFLVIFLSWLSVQHASVGGGDTHAKEGFVELDDLGLERLLRHLREGRGLHGRRMDGNCVCLSCRDGAREWRCRVVGLWCCDKTSGG